MVAASPVSIQVTTTKSANTTGAIVVGALAPILIVSVILTTTTKTTALILRRGASEKIFKVTPVRMQPVVFDNTCCWCRILFCFGGSRVRMT